MVLNLNVTKGFQISRPSPIPPAFIKTQIKDILFHFLEGPGLYSFRII